MTRSVMPIPPVSEYMSTSTHTVGAEQPLSVAHRIMREHQIRHLPVLRGGQIVGLVSQRDLHLVETFKDSDPDEVAVEEAMSQDVLTVAPEACLADVVEMMSERKLGSAVVVRQHRVEGIFTTTDALHALARVLRRAG
jgi:acetoin utilization protein AcuB